MRNGFKSVPIGEREYRWLQKGLRRLGFFSKLDLKSLSHVLPYITLVGLPGRRPVCREGDRGDSFYLIYKGAVEVLKKGWDSPVAELKPGEFFGEMALLFNQPRTATVKTRRPSQLFMLESRDFARLLRRNRSVARTIRQVAQARRRELARS